MEALSRPPRRRETTSTAPLSRKLSTGHSFSSSAKHAYDGVFAAPNRAPSSRSSGIDDYGEIFGGSRASSIPVLDLPSLDESEVLASRRSSKLDYSNIFGGFRNDDAALSYEELFEKPSGAKKTPEEARAAAKGALSSSSPEQLDKMKMSKENQQGSIEEASSEPVDGLKQFNMSYHKTSQRDIEIKNGTTHIAQMHSTPGYTCFIDEGSSPLKKTVSGEYPKISQSQPIQSKASPLSNLGANLVDKRRQHKRPVTEDFKEVPKRNSSKDGLTDYSSTFSDDEEVDLNATAAASVAALKKALETAQTSIRIAKEIMERKGGTQRFEVKKKREEKIPSGGNTKSLGNISKDSLQSGDVSEKDKTKLDNENYKLGSARKHEPASLNNQETDRRTKEIPTTDDILELRNRATDVSEKDKAKQDSQNYKLGSARKHESVSLNNQEIDRRMKEIPTTDDVLELPNRVTDVSEKDKAKLNNPNYELGSARKHEAVSLNNQEIDRRTKEIPTIDDILELPNRATDVSEKDKSKLDNESYKLGLARKLEAASLNNQEIDRRTKEIPTTDDILELPHRNMDSLEEACKVVEVRNSPQDAVNDAVNEHYKSLVDILELPNRNKNSFEEACKVAEVRNTLQDAVIVHYKSDDDIDNRPVAATQKTHELEDDNKVGIYLNDEKLKEKHKLETEESDAKRVCELEIARQLPDASNSPDNKSVASYKVHEEGETNKAEVSQDDIKIHKQEASPEKSEPEINLCLPTEESDKIRVCEEVTKWGPNESEDYSIGSSLIATYEVHEMERVSLNEEEMEDKQEASLRTGRCEAEINACLLLSEESDGRRINQATDKTQKNDKLPSEEAGCEKICEDPPQSEEMNNMAVPQADKESEENKKDFSRQEEYKESAEIEESEEFTDEEVKSTSNQMPKEIFKESVEIEESEVFTGEEVKPASNQMPKEIFTPEILEKENIAVDSKDGIDDEELHESRLKATCELKGVWKNRYLSSWWGAISDTINTKGSNDNEKDNNNEHESKSTGVDALKGVWKSRYLASVGVNKEDFDVESKEMENIEIENGLENKLKGTTCELKGVWKKRYLASDWGAIKESSSVKEAEEICQEDSLSDESERKGDNMNNENQLHKEYDAEESDTSVGDESDDVDESESLFPKIHKFKETVITHGDADHKVYTETETLDNALDASTSHLKAFQDETSSEENGSVSNVANEFVDQDNLDAAAKMEDRVNETYGCEKAEIQGKMDDGPPKDGFDDKQEDSDFSSSSRDDKSYESFSEDKETGPKIEESKESQKLLGVDGNKTKHGDEAKEVKEGKEHVRRTAEMDQKTRDRIVVERAIREVRERAFTEARERAERAAVERATAEVRQRAMAEAREKIEKASAASSKSSSGKASVEARLRAERAAVERATSEARERAREKVALSQKATSSREPAANNEQQGSDGNNGESAQRRKARQERHQRTMERAAKALAEKNQRDLKSQKEQAERNRFAETLDAEVKRWSNGKEGNLRALLSTLQYILGPDSGWQPVQLTEIISIAAVKKTYRRANLHVHPDKLQQRGASIQQKYICEKVFDLLKAAWNKFNSEER